MEDVLPGTLSPIAADGDGWVCAVDATIGKAACALPELAASATASIISIEATVLPGAYPEVTNTATVSSTTPELPGTLEDNTSTVTAPVPALATLTVTKTAVGDFQVGRMGVYEITVRNDGPTEDTGPITVTDELPAGLTFLRSGGDADAVVDGRTVTWTLAGLGVGDEVTLNLWVNVGEAAYPTVDNTVTIDSPTEQTPDAVLTGTVTVEVAAADPLALTGGQAAGGILLLALVLLLIGGGAIVIVRRRRPTASAQD